MRKPLEVIIAWTNYDTISTINIYFKIILRHSESFKSGISVDKEMDGGPKPSNSCCVPSNRLLHEENKALCGFVTTKSATIRGRCWL